MKRILLFLGPLLLITTYSCRDNVTIASDGSYDPNTQIFYSDKIDWSLKVPERWTITVVDTFQSQVKRGVKSIDKTKLLETADIEEEVSVTYLIGFEKNKQNTFTAFTENFHYDKSLYIAANRRKKDFLLASYLDMGLLCDTSWRSEEVDKVEFQVFGLDVLDSLNRVIFNQDYYNTLIDQKSLTILIGYDGIETKNQLIHCIRTSKFGD